MSVFSFQITASVMGSQSTCEIFVYTLQGGVSIYQALCGSYESKHHWASEPSGGLSSWCKTPGLESPVWAQAPHSLGL